MSHAAEARRPCPLCGGRLLAPVFRPPLVRCRGCRLVFRDRARAEERVRDGFEAIYTAPAAERWIQERRASLYREFLARHQPRPGRARLLDVGCGTGEFLRLARQQGWEVTGLEIAEAAVEAGRAAGLPVRLGSLTTAALPERAFDVVTLWNVLDFVADPVAEARAAHRVLAASGVLVVRVGNVAFHATLYRLSRLIRWWPRLGALLARQCFPGEVAFGARALRETLTRAGFESVEIANSRPVSGDPYRTLAGRGDRALQAVKAAVHALAALAAAASGGRALLGPSLWATAIKEPGAAPPGPGGRAGAACRHATPAPSERRGGGFGAGSRKPYNESGQRRARWREASVARRNTERGRH